MPVDKILDLWFHGVVTEPKSTLPMIEKTQVWKVDGELFHTVEDAQAAALCAILMSIERDATLEVERSSLARLLIKESKQVIDILLLSEKPLKPRKPRSDKGKAHKTRPIPTGKRYASVDDLIQDKPIKASAAVNAALQDMKQ